MTNTTAPAAPIAPRIDAREVSRQAHELLRSSAGWIGDNWLRILIASAAGTVIVLALHAVRRLGARLCRAEHRFGGWGVVLGRAVVRTNNFFIVTLAAKLVAGYAGAPPDVASTVNFLFTVAAVFQSAVWARELILGSIEHRTQAENYQGEALPTALGLIRLLVTFVLFAVALVVVLDNLGVNVTGLVAGLGIGGVAIGLAAQGIFADLFAALAIIFDRPFRRGDAITYDQTQGTVEEIGLKSTRIRGVNGEERVISNKNLLDKEIQNNTKRDRRRNKFALGLAYETPPDTLERVPAMLREVVEAHGAEFVRSGFVAFGASTLDFELEYDVPSASYQEAYDRRHVIGVAILRRLDQEGISLPFPIQTNYFADPAGRGILPYAPGAANGSGRAAASNG